MIENDKRAEPTFPATFGAATVNSTALLSILPTQTAFLMNTSSFFSLFS